MTIYTELPTGGTPPLDDFAPVASIQVGDQFVGTSTTGDIDTISLQLVEGAVYTFTGPSSSANLSFGLAVTDTATGTKEQVLGSIDAANAANSTFTFTALSSGTFEIEINAFSVSAGTIPGAPAGTVGSASYNLTLTDVVFAGPTDGDDVLFGGDAPTTIDLMDGNDTWTGVSDPALFVPGQYTDTINAGNGDDSIFGGIGNDEIDGGTGNDLIDLGDGNDNAWGGLGDDILFGGTGRDRLNGNTGDDEIYGGKGSDIINGGKGEDYIDGGDQSDEIWAGAQSDEVYGGNGNDEIFGEEGADVIYGGSGNDKIDGGTFDDLIFGDHGKDTINGGGDNDEIYGGKSDDKLNGNSGDDLLFGGKGNDKLTGGTGNDFLDGGSQSDRLDGGDGDDILIGGIGHDELTGGAGADTFVFSGVVNNDVITDFEVGIDVIDLTGYGPVSIETVLGVGSDTADGVLLDLKGNGSVLLEGVALADLSLSDFNFILDDSFSVG